MVVVPLHAHPTPSRPTPFSPESVPAEETTICLMHPESLSLYDVIRFMPAQRPNTIRYHTQ